MESWVKAPVVAPQAAEDADRPKGGRFIGKKREAQGEEEDGTYFCKVAFLTSLTRRVPQFKLRNARNSNLPVMSSIHKSD